MRLAGILAVAVALAATAADAAPRSGLTPDGKAVLVYLNERVTVRLAGGKPVLVSVAAARPGEALPPKPGPKGPDAPVDLTDAPQGAAVFVASQVGASLALKIDSGLDQAFDYRASGSDGGDFPVCTVLPLLTSYEKWDGRHAVALRLEDFRFRATNEVVCSASSPTSSR